MTTSIIKELKYKHIGWMSNLSEENVINVTELVDDILDLVSKIKEPNKWTSVKDELPEIGYQVLVYCPYKKEKGKNPVTALTRYIRHEGATDYYWDNHYGGCNYHRGDTVTHWMKLPEFKE